MTRASESPGGGGVRSRHFTSTHTPETEAAPPHLAPVCSLPFRSPAPTVQARRDIQQGPPFPGVGPASRQVGGFFWLSLPTCLPSALPGPRPADTLAVRKSSSCLTSCCSGNALPAPAADPSVLSLPHHPPVAAHDHQGAPLASAVPSVSHSRGMIDPSTPEASTQIQCASYSRASSRTFHWLPLSFPVLLHLLMVTS